MLYSEVRRFYFLATDLHNAADRVLAHELDCLYEGKTVVVFIDCYDLIAFLFEEGKLTSDNHHDWIRRIWTETFRDLDASDNLKVTISPPTFLELSHYLERKAHYVYAGLPTVSRSDLKNWKTFFSKVLPILDTYAETRQLVDEASGSVPHLALLRELMHEGKIVSANDIFDYSAADWKQYDRTVGRKFNSEGAANYLREKRSIDGSGGIVRPSSPEFEFAINVDVSNIAQTIFISDTLQETTEIRLAAHGMWLLLCCRPDKYWRDRSTEPPVINSWLALLLVRALRNFSTKDDAREYFSSVKTTARNFLTDLVAFIESDDGLSKYIHLPESRSDLANAELELPRRLEVIYEYLFEIAHNLCLPDPVEEPTSIRVGVTGPRRRDTRREREEAMEFLIDKEKQKEYAESVLGAIRNSLEETTVLRREEVTNLYYPPGEVATETLLKLDGYSLSDWHKYGKFHSGGEPRSE